MIFVAWFLILILFWAGYYLLTKGRLTHHIGFLHYLIFFYLIYVGSLTIYNDQGASNIWYVVNVLLYPVLSLLGMFFATFLMGNVHVEGGVKPASKRDVGLTTGAVVLFLAAYAVYLHQTESLSPLKLLLATRDREAAYLARFLVTKGYEDVNVPGFLIWFPRIFIDYFSSFVLVFSYYHFRNKPRVFLKTAILFSGLIMFALENTEKYPAMRLCLVMALCMYNARRPILTFKSFGFIFAMMVVVVFFSGAVYALVAGMFGTYYHNYLGRGFLSDIGTVMWFGLQMLGNRAVEGENLALYMTYTMVPNVYDFFHGTTFDNLHGFIPYQRHILPYLVFDFYNIAPPGVQGSATTIYFGEIYANFGNAAAWLSMFGFGFIVQFLNNKLASDVNRYGSPLFVAFYYMVAIYLCDYAQGFCIPFLDARVWFFVLFYFVARMKGGTGLLPERFEACRAGGRAWLSEAETSTASGA